MIRQVWSSDELLALARALALGMTTEQRQGLARLLLALGLPAPVIVAALGGEASAGGDAVQQSPHESLDEGTQHIQLFINIMI